MKVYIVVQEPFHDNSTVLGVYANLQKAKDEYPGDWVDNGFYITKYAACVAERNNEDAAENVLIYEHEVQR